MPFGGKQGWKINTVITIVLFIVGLILVTYFAEKLVKGAVGTSLAFGLTVLNCPHEIRAGT